MIVAFSIKRARTFTMMLDAFVVAFLSNSMLLLPFSFVLFLLELESLNDENACDVLIGLIFLGHFSSKMKILRKIGSPTGLIR